MVDLADDGSIVSVNGFHQAAVAGQELVVPDTDLRGSPVMIPIYGAGLSADDTAAASGTGFIVCDSAVTDLAVHMGGAGPQGGVPNAVFDLKPAKLQRFYQAGYVSVHSTASHQKY